MLTRLLSLLALTALVLGCTSRAPRELATSPGGPPGPRITPANPTAPAEESAPSGRGAGPAEADAYAGYAPPSRRSGLGTTFGEARTSHVTEVPFERASYEPSAWTSVRYDDWAGVGAATRYASGLRPHELPLLGGALVMRVVDGDERPLPSVSADGTSYVVGERNERYQLLIENRSSSRFEIVATVDGLDVLDGLPGSPAKRGYLVAPHATLIIDGFRTSPYDVAAFRFGTVDESYAASKGASRNVGVIGLAAFAERVPEWQPGRRYAEPPRERYPYELDELQRRRSADPFPAR